MTNKKELREVRFDATEIILKDNLVRGSILPQKIAELTRNIIFNGNVEVEGAIFAQRIEVRDGDLTVKGAAFAQGELYVNSDATGDIVFAKATGSAGSVTARSNTCKPMFYADINAKTVALKNAYIAGSIYADEITLDNCVVIGGVFATQEASLTDCVIGTFNAPHIHLAGIIQLLLPSAFTIEKPEVAPGTKLYNLSLADLGALFRGAAQDPNSGRIAMNLETDEVKADLTDENTRRTLRSLSVIGKVLAADMIDTDRFQNHFLLTTAALGPQLLRTYDMGVGSDGKQIKLDEETLRNFFFDILTGKKEPRELDNKFSLADLAR